MTEIETLLPKSEAARQLGVSRRTLDRIIEDGKIEVLQPSSGVKVIAASEIQRYIASLIRKSRGEHDTTPQPAAEPAAAG